MKSILRNIALFSIMTVASQLGRVPLLMAAGVPEFNTIVGDKALLRGCDITKNPTCTEDDLANPVNATTGDQVVIGMYYHNSVAGSEATNTTFRIMPDQAASTSHIVKGSISADNAQTVTSTFVNGQEVGSDLAINSDTTSTLSYVPGSFRWYPDRTATTGSGTNLPGNQNGDAIVTSAGVNIGTLAGCFQHSGYVSVIVKLNPVTVSPTPSPTPVPTATPTPAPTPSPTPVPVGHATLQITKEVRNAGSSDAYTPSLTTNVGNSLQYRITIRNIDGKVAANDLHLQDILPAGEVYVGPTSLSVSNGTITTLPNGLTGQTGISLGTNLSPNDSVQVSYLVNTDKNLANNTCLTNQAIASSSTVENTVKSSATTCFLAPVVTPVPSATPTPYIAPPTPTPQLPRTGAGVDTLLAIGMSGSSMAAAYYMRLKKRLSDAIKSQHIL
jgi:uncharacterized repeat protein (TIGR01451 family)